MADLLTRAFPSSVLGAATKVVALLPTASFEPAQGFVVSVEGESVEIPSRIYNTELPDNTVADWPQVEQTVYACLYTRHHNGHTRQRHLRRILGVSDYWVTPFVVQLIGEYVIEILVDIQLSLRDVETHDSPQHAQYKRFALDNPRFIEATSARVISYWNCYFRSAYPALRDYPGFQLIASLKRAGAQAT